jgi:hypothetical protein
MKYLGITWAIVWNLLVIFVTLVVLTGLEYDNSLVPAALGFMILGTLNITSTIQARAKISSDILSQRRDVLLLSALAKSEEANELSEIWENECNEGEKTLSKSQYKVSINAFGTIVIWLISVFSILGSL